jgi:competence protein ComEA
MAEERLLPLSHPLHESPPRRLFALAASIRGSTWWPVALRVGAVVLALVVLGWIGRSAAANPGGTTSASIAGMDRDAAVSATTTDAGTTSAPAEAPAPIASSPPPAPSSGTSRAHASSDDPVYLNQASVDELRRLPGVGPKRAEAILVLRQRLGRFQRVEDLLRVKGVGRGAVKKWRPLVRLDTPGREDGGLR